VQSHDYTPILALANLEHLTLGNDKGVSLLLPQLGSLAKLKWGTLKEKPELFTK
jgi:hypothetical protein